MFNYKVFNSNDIWSYPIENQNLIIWINDYEYPIIGQFKNSSIHTQKGEIIIANQFIYDYTGKRPIIKKEIKSKKCHAFDSHCEYYDDGYCWNCPYNCQYSIEITEYSLED